MACFFDPKDFRKYREILREGLKRYDVALHAYVLMTNHVHLLVTPSEKVGISRVMQHVGRCYVGYVNWRYQRTGTLWEGRHKASLIDSDAYLLRVYRYIEMNPVRAGMVNHPGKYPWSSFSSNTRIYHDALITPHDVYLSLADDAAKRVKTYLDLFDQGLSRDELKEIRCALAYNFPLGNDRFKLEIEKMLGRKIGRNRRGRPKGGN